MNYSKEYIYFGIFNDGKLLFRVWNRIPKNDMNIVIADRLCALAEESLSPVLRDGDYIAFDYERGR